MDPLAQAFAFFEFDSELGRVVHTRGLVQPKYLINASAFPFGFATPDNRWDNFWRSGQNAVLGWGGASAGAYGAQSLGIEVASSRAFSICQVEKVFTHVCFRPAGDTDDLEAIERIADGFEEDYSMKRVFASV